MVTPNLEDLKGGIPLDNPVTAAARKFTETLTLTQAPAFIAISPLPNGGLNIAAEGNFLLLLGLLSAAQGVLNQQSFGQAGVTNDSSAGKA